MLKIYHVTKVENYEKIKKDGKLIPQIGPLSKKANEEQKQIYFFKSHDDVNTALGSWLGEQYEDDEKLVILEFKVPNHLSGLYYPTDRMEYEVTLSKDLPLTYLMHQYDEIEI